MSSRWRRFEVLLPLRFNDGRDVPGEWIADGTAAFRVATRRLLRRIRLAPRLTPHVRHVAKYIDVPVAEQRAFVFWRNGSPDGRRARTLREFVAAVEHLPPAVLDGHLRRGDFSRWLVDVFGDHPLAKTIRELEARYRTGSVPDIAATLAQAVRSRYEFLEPVPW